MYRLRDPETRESLRHERKRAAKRIQRSQKKRSSSVPTISTRDADGSVGSNPESRKTLVDKKRKMSKPGNLPPPAESPDPGINLQDQDINLDTSYTPQEAKDDIWQLNNQHLPHRMAPLSIQDDPHEPLLQSSPPDTPNTR